MRVIILFAFLSLSLLVNAQTVIRGTTIDGEGIKLSGVEVIVKGTNVSTFSDENGNYQISVPAGNKTLVFSLSGFQVVEMNVDGDVIDVRMSKHMDDLFELSLEQLLTMEIETAGKTKQKVADIPASVVVVEREEIERYGYQTLFELLSNVPGFYKHDNYSTVSFGVRGFFSNVPNRSFVLLVNGVPQAQPQNAWNSENLTTIQVETIDRVEIVRGPMAIMYGVNAFFGAINIITNEKKDNEASSQVSSGYGTDNTYRFNVQTELKGAKTRTSISAGYYHTDGRDISFDPILDAVSDYKGTMHTGRTTKDFFKKKSHFLNVSSAFNDFYTNVSFDETDRNNINYSPPILDTLKISYLNRTMRGNIGYRKDIGERFTVDARVDLVSASRYQNVRMLFVQPIKINYGEQWSKSTRWSGELAMLYRPIDDMLITLGGKSVSTEYIYTLTVEKVSNNISYEADRPIIENSVFSQIDYKLNDQFSFVAGARLEKQERYEMTNSYFSSTGEFIELDYSYDIDDIVIVPRFAAVYKPTERSSLKLMYGEALTRPAITENTLTSNILRPNLKPQFISTTEINYMAALTDQIALSTSVFYNKLDQLLISSNTRDLATGKMTFSPDNSGELETIGGELQLQYSPLDALSFDLAVSYHNTQNKKYDIQAAYSPELLAYLKAWYKVTDDISFAITSNYVGEMETFWVETSSEPGEPNSQSEGRFYETTPSYWLLNANFRYNNIMGTGLYFSLQGTNLLNEDVFYGPTTANSSFLPKGTYDTGIGVFANLGLKF